MSATRPMIDAAPHPDDASPRPRSGVVLLLLAAMLGGSTIVPGCSEKTPAGSAVQTRPVVHEGTPAKPRPTTPLASGTSCVSSGCHATFATASFVHGIVRGGDGCSLCHADDEGTHVYPLRRPGNEGCTYCHESVVGNRDHQHGGAAVACLACHDPHVSEHTALRRAPVETLCVSCHPAENHAVPHGPFEQGACLACHDPHESDHPGLLRATGSEHCYLCHDAIHEVMTQSPRIHSPAAQGCLVCHAAHGSDHPHGLREPIDVTCFSCHTDLEQTIVGVDAPHGALSLRDQCANCHDAHGSSHPSFLKDRQDALCLKCHDEPLKARDGRTIPSMTAGIRGREFLHGPVETGHCTACHNVHGASHARLLRQRFAESFYAAFDLEHYALCFQCHEQDLVTTERTTSLTAFRDGDVNLHYLHVNRDTKGRTCRACHEIHGSDLPAHVAESVPFGGSSWPLPIAFQQTATGGSCAPGCHVPMSYSRDAAPSPSGEEP